MNKYIEELEKIKEEIRELSYNGKICTIDRYRVEEVINKHIEELKEGEGKQKEHIHQTDCLWYDEEYCEVSDCSECGMIDEMEGDEDAYI